MKKIIIVSSVAVLMISVVFLVIYFTYTKKVISTLNKDTSNTSESGTNPFGKLVGDTVSTNNLELDLSIEEIDAIKKEKKEKMSLYKDRFIPILSDISSNSEPNKNCSVGLGIKENERVYIVKEIIDNKSNKLLLTTICSPENNSIGENISLVLGCTLDNTLFIFNDTESSNIIPEESQNIDIFSIINIGDTIVTTCKNNLCDNGIETCILYR